MFSRRLFLHRLMSCFVCAGFSGLVLAEKNSLPKQTQDSEFIIINGWVLLKSDLERT